MMIDNGWQLGSATDSAGKTSLHRAAQLGNAAAVKARAAHRHERATCSWSCLRMHAEDTRRAAGDKEVERTACQLLSVEAKLQLHPSRKCDG